MSDEELIDAYFHGEASNEQVKELEARLQADATSREIYRRYGEMVYGLEVRSRVGEPEAMASTGSSAPLRRLIVSWRQLAAACVVTAVLTCSATALYVERLLRPSEHLPVLDEGFESESIEIGKRSPVSAGNWSGDGVALTAGEGLPQAYEGARYVQLAPHATRKLSHLEGLIDLRSAHALRAERGARQVRLYCRAMVRPEALESQPNARYKLRLATFQSPPEAAANEWRQGPPHEYAVTYSQRFLRIKQAPDGWHLLETTVDVPPDVQSAMLSISATSHERGNHCVDAVHAELAFDF